MTLVVVHDILVVVPLFSCTVVSPNPLHYCLPPPSPPPLTTPPNLTSRTLPMQSTLSSSPCSLYSSGISYSGRPIPSRSVKSYIYSLFIFQPYATDRAQHNKTLTTEKVNGRPIELMKEFCNAYSIKTWTVCIVNKWSLSFLFAKVVTIGVTLVNHAL